jgi:hypothetical protein
MSAYKFINGHWLILSVVGIGVSDPTAYGQGSAQAPRARTTEARPAQKLMALEMREQPWGRVLEWLADQTGLPVTSDFKPTGTFTFLAPKGSTQQYTIPQVIDILNEGLISQKFLLIRRERSFTIVPADEKIDPALLPRLRPQELDERGNTELASMVLSLGSTVAEDAAKEVKELLGPFGQVVPLVRSNQLLVQDTVGNLKRIARTLHDIEDNSRNDQDLYSYVCKHAKAHEAVRIIMELLGDPRELPRSVPATPFGGAGRGQARAPEPAPPSRARGRRYYLAADERTNSVLLRGPADTLNLAKEILKRIDLPAEGRRVVDSGASFKRYNLANGKFAARILQEVYKTSTSVRISVIDDQSVLVYANPEEQFEIAKLLTGLGGFGPNPRETTDSTVSRAEALFRRLDQNGDGLLNHDEMPEALRAERDKWDTNKDGFIDLGEFKAYFQARMAPVQTDQAERASPGVAARQRGSERGGTPRSRPNTGQPGGPATDEKLNRILERLDSMEKRLDRLDKAVATPRR